MINARVYAAPGPIPGAIDAPVGRFRRVSTVRDGDGEVHTFVCVLAHHDDIELGDQVQLTTRADVCRVHGTRVLSPWLKYPVTMDMIAPWI